MGRGAGKRRQDAGKFYRLNGAIYIVNIDRFTDQDDIDLYQRGSFAYIMSQENSVDIDTDIDFRLASVILAPEY